ncbi:MAG: GNAT family N-acetyltransferase, partial [Clostridia bacterium]
MAWEEYWRWDVEDEIVAIYYTQAHQPTGYLVYTLANEHMTVKEMVYLNPEARQGLWNYISAH